MSHEFRIPEYTTREGGKLLAVLAPCALGIALYMPLAAAVNRGPPVEGTLAKLRAPGLYDDGALRVADAGFPGRGRVPARFLNGIRASCCRRAVHGSSGDRRCWLAVIQKGSRDGAQGILHDDDAHIAHIQLNVGIVIVGIGRGPGGGRGAAGQGVQLVDAVLVQILGIREEQMSRVNIFLNRL